MSSNQLYGNEYILKERSSGYRSTAYALAEIVDNSVDAGATDVDIFFIDRVLKGRNSERTSISEILVCDNGSGMTLDILNRCLTFSEGLGRSDRRIGAFGVGLPKSSISIARNVEVYSRTDSDSDWFMVSLSIDDQLSRKVPSYDEARKATPNFLEGEDIKTYKTIVRWTDLDRVDYRKGKTLCEHVMKLFGRIYRYPLREGLKIHCIERVESIENSSEHRKEVLIYDPMFLKEGRTYISDKVWDSVENPKGQYKHMELGHLAEYDSRTYYKKFVEGYSREKGCAPLFMKYEDFYDVDYSITLNGVKYKWKIFAALAGSDLTNPGLRSGGGTLLGQEIGIKMSGKNNFKSGNIFFIRAGREIDFGSFGLYKVTEEKNRWWTIEIHFESELDELMGLANNKQSVQFQATEASLLDSFSEEDELPTGEMREHLWEGMTSTIKRAIKEMKKVHRSYAQKFRDAEAISIRSGGDDSAGPVQLIHPTVIQALPRGEDWTTSQVEDVSTFLKEKYPHLELARIKKQVENYAKGKTSTFVLYAPSESGHLFELTERRNKQLTLINTNHPYYRNILGPLKEHPQLDVLSISLEMFLSSQSLAIDQLIIDNEQRFKIPLERFRGYFSTKLAEFIEDYSISINVDEFYKSLEGDEEIIS